MTAPNCPDQKREERARPTRHLWAETFAVVPRKSPLPQPSRAPYVLGAASLCVVLAMLLLPSELGMPPVPDAGTEQVAEVEEAHDAMTDVVAPMGGDLRADRSVPEQPARGQKKPPCDRDMGEASISGACYVVTDVKPPCGRLYRWGEKCVRALVVAPRQPTSIDGGVKQ